MLGVGNQMMSMSLFGGLLPIIPAAYMGYELIGHRRFKREQYTAAWALHAGYVVLQTNTLRICNNYCFSKATIVMRTRLYVTLYTHGFSLHIYIHG